MSAPTPTATDPDPATGAFDVATAAATSAATGPAAALPVAIELRGRLADPVRRAVEGQLGWQPVDDVTASLVPPALRLTDVHGRVDRGVPTVLLLAAEDAPLAVADAVRRLRPDGVAPWPCEVAVLADAAAAATAAPRRDAATATVLRIGGASGGVGTTTAALVLAGVIAWRGRATLVASTDAVLLPSGAPTVEPGALAAVDLWRRSAPLEGVPGARAVRTTAPPRDAAPVDPDVEVAVLDAGVAEDVDVLVCRPDAHGLAALGRSTAAAVVVVGDGPVPQRRLADATGGRRRIRIPRSARVARAAVVGRVPSSVPGSVVRSFLALAPSAGDDRARPVDDRGG